MHTECYQCWNFWTLGYSPQPEKYQDFQGISFHIQGANSVHINERLFKFTYIMNTALAKNTVKLYIWQTMWTDIKCLPKNIEISHSKIPEHKCREALLRSIIISNMDDEMKRQKARWTLHSIHILTTWEIKYTWFYATYRVPIPYTFVTVTKLQG